MMPASSYPSKDDEAPISQIADISLAGDPINILPELQTAL
jgi:electron transfer flavoprotein alpha subunit